VEISTKCFKKTGGNRNNKSSNDNNVHSSDLTKLFSLHNTRLRGWPEGKLDMTYKNYCLEKWIVKGEAYKDMFQDLSFHSEDF
jgi:hypothetical protein